MGASTARVPHKRLASLTMVVELMYMVREYVDTLDTYQNQNSKGQKLQIRT